MAVLAVRGIALCVIAIASLPHGYRAMPAEVPALAYASFAPLNTDLFVANAEGGDARPLLSHAANDYNASFSADGRWITFTSERDGSADLYRVHPDGTALERLTDYIGFDDQGALSPDARVLAFVSTRGGQADIWMLDLATRGVHNLTNHPAGDFRPAWSPDGEWLAFSSDRSSTRPRYQFTVVQSTEIYVVRRDGTGLRRLTNSGAYLGSPSWSSDGRSLLVYKAEVSEVAKITTPRRLRGTTQIATIDVATGEERALSSGPGEKWSPRFLPDRRVAYVSGGPERGLEFTSGAAGARGEFASPSWSPDGRRMIFHRDVGDDWPPHRAAYSLDPRYRLVRTGVFASYAPSGDRLVLNDGTAGIVHNRVLVMDADGTHRTVLLSDSVKSALAPAWSPQGDRIAFAFGRFFPAVLGSSAAAIAVTPVDRPDPTLLTDPGENAGFPSWSPDGRRLVYRVAREGRSALMIVDIGTRAVRQLTDWSSNDNSPSWSPCGDRIVFTSNRDPSGDYDLYTIRPDGTDLRRLTSSPGNDSHPAWSPDCEWIAFTSARGGFKDESALHPANPQPYGDINVVRPDGSDVRRLTDDQFEDGTPTWIPNKPAQVGSAPAPPREHIYRTVDGVPLKAFVFSPARTTESARTPAILLFHGGGWVAGAPDWTFANAQRYAALGLVAISVEYRLSSDRITPIEALDDVCSAFRWARAAANDLAIDPRRIAASGVSAGGHLAAAAATIGCGSTDGAYGTGGPDALVLWSPAVDVSGDGHFRRLLGERATVEALNPVEHVRARMPPVVVVHGERDNLTPLSGVRRFCHRVEAGGGRCVVHVYPGVGHLLTRNLANQESDFDPDPVARADGNAKQLEFLRRLWLR